MTTLMFNVFDTIKSDLKDLHPADRMAASARMMGRPGLIRNDEFRAAFSAWRRGVAL